MRQLSLLMGDGSQVTQVTCCWCALTVEMVLHNTMLLVLRACRLQDAADVAQGL